MFDERSSEWRRAHSDAGPNTCWAHCCRSPKSTITLASNDYHRPCFPSLVPNHLRSLRISPIKAELHDMNDLSQKSRSKMSMCFGCGSQIHDQYILRVSPDLEWHAECLRCAGCQKYLDENCTCFVKDGKTYCRTDYYRLFGYKCDKCNMNFQKTDLVMRAKTKIYHIKCFKCDACQKSLETGQEFALRPDGLFCKEDHEELSSKTLNSENNNNNSITNNNNNNNNKSSNNNNNNNNKSSSVKYHHHNHIEGSNSDSSESGSDKYSHREVIRSGSTKGVSDGKPTRVRTVLNEKQLHTLKNCYAANPRPDALMKEQLVEMTGLNPRVIRVWFQNKRCKDKKRAIAMKQQMQHEKEGRKMGYGSMQGIPMVASSPVRHESPLSMNPIEVQSYPAPWKALSDFALHTDLDRLDPSAPHFQQLVNQMHGYDMHRSMGMRPHDVVVHQPSGPQAPAADMIHPDSTDSLVTYMDSDESLQHDPGTP